MEVRNLIKPNATVVKITEISVGDVYKRLDTPSYGDPRVLFGVVTDVLNNGEQSSLVALEFNPNGYSLDIKAEIKVFSGATDVAIFPATTGEYKEALHDAIAQQRREVDKAEQDFLKKRDVLDRMTVQLDSSLSSATTLEITK